MASKKCKAVGATLVALGMAASIYFAPDIVNAQQNKLTGTDLVNNYYTINYLTELEETNNISFQNKELYDTLYEHFNRSFSASDLREITTLNITTEFTNMNFSDLKYLTNLKTLTIENNQINCEDLKYNQNLQKVIFNNCSLTNTTELPNTITNIEIKNTNIADNIFVIPYKAVSVKSFSSSFNKIQFKNPDKLSSFYHSGYGFLDIDDLVECTNLYSITLSQTPNILNSDKLTTFKKATIILDEFCTVWLDKKTLRGISSISEDTKDLYINIIEELDNTAKSLVYQGMTEKEAINNMIIYVLNQIEYDYSALGEDEESRKLCHDYNKKPISYTLNGDSGVCVNYATLFTALAKRIGVDIYQPDSINHTWNMIRLVGENEYRAYDLTALDNKNADIIVDGNIVFDENKNAIDYINAGQEEQLLFYGFNFNQYYSPSYETYVEPKEVNAKSVNIGYIDNRMSTYEINTIRQKALLLEAMFILLAVAVNGIINKARQNTSRRNNNEEKQIIKCKRVN